MVFDLKMVAEPADWYDPRLRENLTYGCRISALLRPLDRKVELGGHAAAEMTPPTRPGASPGGVTTDSDRDDPKSGGDRGPETPRG